MKNTHKMTKSYFLGFVLSVILTVIPFYVVEYYNTIDKLVLFIIVISCAIVQIYVHLTLFLHLHNTAHQTWHLISLIFTIFIISTLVLGSIWIMKHLHHNLMI